MSFNFSVAIDYFSLIYQIIQQLVIQASEHYCIVLIYNLLRIIILPAMEELHITLVSKDLKYNLSSLKIKTLQKAEEFLPKCTDTHRSDKILAHLTLYKQIKQQARIKLFQINKDDDQIDLQELPSKDKKVAKQIIFYSCLTKPCITEVFGSKSTGKTALLIHLAQKFNQYYPEKTVKIINCASGFTIKRFEQLNKKCKLIYCDAFTLENALDWTTSVLSENNVSCLIIDSLTNLLMAQQKTRIYLIKLFGILEQLISKNVTVLISNYMQQRIQHKGKLNCYNNFSYFSAITSQFIKYKYFLNRQPKGKITQINMVKGGNLAGQFKICSTGIQQINFI